MVPSYSIAGPGYDKLPMTDSCRNLPATLQDRRKKFRRGLTLTEGLIALGLFAAAIAIAAWMGSLGMASFRAVQFNSEIQVIQDVINQTTQGTTDLSQLSSAAVAESGALPTKYVPNNGSTIASPFGSLITITGTGIAGGTNGLTTYTLSIPQVPKSACVKSMATDYGNSIVSRTPAGDGVNGGPSSAMAAAQACTSQTSNTITLEFIRN